MFKGFLLLKAEHGIIDFPYRLTKWKKEKVWFWSWQKACRPQSELDPGQLILELYVNEPNSHV